MDNDEHTIDALLKMIEAQQKVIADLTQRVALLERIARRIGRAM